MIMFLLRVFICWFFHSFAVARNPISHGTVSEGEWVNCLLETDC